MTVITGFRRGALERLLGTGRFQFVDDGHGLRATVYWPCGCRATEDVEADRYALSACELHATVRRPD